MHYASVGAGLYDGYIKTASGDQYDIHAVVTMEGDPQQDEVEIKGDDEVKATFVNNQREEVTIQANGVNFETLQAITGNNLTSNASGLSIPLGTDTQVNPVNVEVGALTRAQDANRVAVVIKKVWHNVEIKSIKISQAGEQEFNIEMTATAYKTATDIVGASLTPARVATLSVNY